MRCMQLFLTDFLGVTGAGVAESHMADPKSNARGLVHSLMNKAAGLSRLFSSLFLHVVINGSRNASQRLCVPTPCHAALPPQRVAYQPSENASRVADERRDKTKTPLFFRKAPPPMMRSSSMSLMLTTIFQCLRQQL